VGAEDARVVGQRGDALEGVVHLPGRSFEEAAAAGAEQRVATEQAAVAVEGDVAEGMPRHRHHAKFESEVCKADSVSIVEPPRRAGHSLSRRAEDRRAVPPRQRRDPADVVGMMVRDEDGTQGEPLIIQGRLDRTASPGSTTTAPARSSGARISQR
jgi:hypothetical protein